MKEEVDSAIINADNREHLRLMNEALFHGYYYRPGHRWAYYDAWESKFPSRKELSTMKGILFPGSYMSAYDYVAHPWIKELFESIRMVYKDFPNVQLVGICFGHQAISMALGGNVERM
jgi:GMP synthase-like glutamine amidotransferase